MRGMKITAIIGLVVALVAVPALVQGQQQVVIEAEIKGTVNGAPLAGSGTLILDLTRGEGRARINYSQIPSSFTPLAVSSSSIVSAICGSGGGKPPSDRVLTIFDVSGGNFDFTMRSVVRDGDRTIGDVLTEGTLRSGKAVITVSGSYTGPLDLVSSPGYVMRLRQIAPGKIEATYTQTIFRKGGGTITSEVTRTYSYSGPSLPFNEKVDFQLTALSFVPPIQEFTFKVIYMPDVPTVTQWGLIALGLLLAGSLAWMIRRRVTVRPAGA